MVIASREVPFATSTTGTSDIPLTAIEYFAGVGLFRMGLEHAGWSVEFANDWDGERAQIYEGFFWG